MNEETFNWLPREGQGPAATIHFSFLKQEGEVRPGEPVLRLHLPASGPAAAPPAVDREPAATAAPQELSFTYVIKDPLGIHGRPAGAIAHLVKGFDCSITIRANGKSAAARRMSALLRLGAVQGTTLEVSGEGAEAARAICELKKFLAEKL